MIAGPFNWRVLIDRGNRDARRHINAEFETKAMNITGHSSNTIGKLRRVDLPASILINGRRRVDVVVVVQQDIVVAVRFQFAGFDISLSFNIRLGGIVAIKAPGTPSHKGGRGESIVFRVRRVASATDTPEGSDNGHQEKDNQTAS